MFTLARPAGGVLLQVGRRRCAPPLRSQFQTALLVDDGVVAACRGPEHPRLRGVHRGRLDVVLLHAHRRSRAVLVDVEAEAGLLADQHDVVVVQRHDVPDLPDAVAVALQRIDLELGLTGSPALGCHHQAVARLVANPVRPTGRECHGVPLLLGPHQGACGQPEVTQTVPVMPSVPDHGWSDGPSRQRRQATVEQ